MSINIHRLGPDEKVFYTGLEEHLVDMTSTSTWQQHRGLICPPQVLESTFSDSRVFVWLTNNPENRRQNNQTTPRKENEKKKRNMPDIQVYSSQAHTFLICTQFRAVTKCSNEHREKQQETATKERPREETHAGCLVKRSRSAAFSLAVLGNTLSLAMSDMSLISRTQFPSDSSVLA